MVGGWEHINRRGVLMEGYTWKPKLTVNLPAKTSINCLEIMTARKDTIPPFMMIIAGVVENTIISQVE